MNRVIRSDVRDRSQDNLPVLVNRLAVWLPLIGRRRRQRDMDSPVWPDIDGGRASLLGRPDSPGDVGLRDGGGPTWHKIRAAAMAAGASAVPAALHGCTMPE